MNVNDTKKEVILFVEVFGYLLVPVSRKNSGYDVDNLVF